jgi:hypothetical protein
MSLEEKIASWNDQKLREGLEVIIVDRMLKELVLVDALRTVDKDLKPIPKEETLKSFLHTLNSERIFIRKLGLREASRLYAKHQGITSAMSTVKFVLDYDYETYYRNLLKEKKEPK